MRNKTTQERIKMDVDIKRLYVEEKKSVNRTATELGVCSKITAKVYYIRELQKRIRDLELQLKQLSLEGGAQ